MKSIDMQRLLSKIILLLGYTGERNSAIRFRRNIDDIQRVNLGSLLLVLCLFYLQLDDKRVCRDGEA